MIEHSIIGYHGTDAANFTNISTNNFRPSVGDSHWLGTGTYFFTDGYPNNLSSEHASAKWAEVEAWDKKLKKNRYTACCVIEATISVNKDFFLDLTTSEGMEVFNYYRKSFVETLKKANVKFSSKSLAPIFRDGELINQMRNISGMRIDVTRGHFYFKYKEERMFQADFRLPNCTILAVFDCKNNVEKSKIKIITKFKIS